MGGNIRLSAVQFARALGGVRGGQANSRGETV